MGYDLTKGDSFFTVIFGCMLLIQSCCFVLSSIVIHPVFTLVPRVKVLRYCGFT